ncbi:MAG: DNA cytosine methyltransferase [Chloroflexota bacterium]|nr:DNA cytosine methyltransferase [Chloroflexota bacterium]
MESVELFTGVGGLAMGIAGAGFRHHAVIERDRAACATLRANAGRAGAPVADWPLVEADVRTFDYATLPVGLDLLAGGPPCQPFSLGGKHAGPRDSRDLFPEAVRAVRELQPRAFLFENVRGLLRQSFARYFAYILLQLTYPAFLSRPGESWLDHLGRLEGYHTAGSCTDLGYGVVFRSLNAADYGVPQKRERVILVGLRRDLGLDWAFPAPTHALDALLWSQWVTSAYWERHEIARRDRPLMPPALQSRVARLRASLFPPPLPPWRTVRDALADLPDPLSAAAQAVSNHRFVPGARSYPGHTGSLLDEPAKTLKAGDHGVPGGENTLAAPDGRVRYFTVRESARLQTFPDAYCFTGSWTESMRQLGNAVPVTLAQVLATSLHARLAPPEQC